MFGMDTDQGRGDMKKFNTSKKSQASFKSLRSFEYYMQKQREAELRAARAGHAYFEGAKGR